MTLPDDANPDLQANRESLSPEPSIRAQDPSPGTRVLTRLKGSASVKLSTDEILALTRGD